MANHRICKELYREVRFDELPHLSWQREVYQLGWRFFEPAQASQSIESVRRNVARIEAGKAHKIKNPPETVSNVGYIVLMHSIINGPGPYNSDRYAHMAPED